MPIDAFGWKNLRSAFLKCLDDSRMANGFNIVWVSSDANYEGQEFWATCGYNLALDNFWPTCSSWFSNFPWVFFQLHSWIFLWLEPLAVKNISNKFENPSYDTLAKCCSFSVFSTSVIKSNGGRYFVLCWENL